MIPRSARRERRDTVLALPAIGALQAMPPETTRRSGRRSR